MADSRNKLQQRLKYGAASTIRSLKAKKRGRQLTTRRRRKRTESKREESKRGESKSSERSASNVNPILTSAAAAASSSAGSARNYVQKSKKLSKTPTTPTRPTDAKSYAEPATKRPNSAEESTPAAPVSFISSLQLNAEQMQQFISGSFLYLRPRVAGQQDAYNLEIAPHQMVDRSDYHTISKHGITHFQGSNVDFTSLDDWEREFTVFFKIKNIKFFRRYRKWKSFYQWMRSISNNRFKKAGKRLNSNLFLFNPLLQTPLLHLHELCEDAKVTELIEVDVEKTYKMSEFVDVQSNRRHAVADLLLKLMEQVVMLIRGACDDVLDKFLKRNQIDGDHKLTFMERASLRKECQKLVRFVRMTDFVLQDTLRFVAVESASAFLQYICPKIKPPTIIRLQAEDDDAPVKVRTKHDEKVLTPLFTVDVSFGEDGLQLVPSRSSIMKTVKQILLDAVQVVSRTKRLMQHEELAPYTAVATEKVEDSSAEKHDLPSQVLNDPRFSGSRKSLLTGLQEALQSTFEHCHMFEKYQEIYLENADTQENIVERYTDVPIKVFTQLIDKFRAQGQDFSGIPYSADVGIIRADSSELKARLLPSPDKCLEALKNLIPKLIQDLAQELNDVLASLNPKLSKESKGPEEFVSKMKVLQQAQELMPELKKKKTRIGDLRMLVAQESWVLNDSIKAYLTMLEEQFNRLEQLMTKVDASKDAETTKWAKMIMDSIVLLNKNVVKYRAELEVPMLAEEDTEERQALGYLGVRKVAYDKLKHQADTYQEYQAVLGQQITEFESLEDLGQDLSQKLKLWEGLRDWQDLTNKYKTEPFSSVDAEAIRIQVTKFNKTAVVCARTLPGNKAVPKLKAMVDDFSNLLPAILALRTHALKSRHWKQIEELIDDERFVEGLEGVNIGMLIDAGVMNHEEKLTEIATRAVQEGALDELFDTKVKKVWQKAEFIVREFKDSKDVFILGAVDDVLADLDDSLVTLNTILGSRYCSHIRLDVTKYQRDLILLQETLDEWLACQKQWMYLESIFSAADIQRQLPKEAKMFKDVDNGWKSIMADTSDLPNCLKCGTVQGRKELLKGYNNTLDRIQKSLEDYLETKRQAFARFYFISNDELLQILAKSRDPNAVQPYLRKCFDALVKLEFGTGTSPAIKAMFSPKGERVALPANLKARAPVQEWLGNVENGMKKALHAAMKAAVIDYDQKPRTRWIRNHPGQIVATGAQIMWSRGCEKTIMATEAGDEGALSEWFDVNCKMVSDLVAVVRGKISKLERRVIVALVTTDVHARDIVEKMRDRKVAKLTNFLWMQQLRYYWDKNEDDCIVRQSNAKFNYGYEYMGCTSRLVITPLTDRCWLTITGSIHLKLGAAPAGPAGTGKTESTKDLAKAMGMFCIVFNCSDQIDYKMMAKLFAGLAQTGMWTCLDEFNRIIIEVLSVVAQQLFTLKASLERGDEWCHFEGRKIKVMTFSVNVTMNPGYAGRTELPDNLKVFFRPVAMMIPDYALIAEIMLFAEGFDDSRNLARKMIKMYKLFSEQLSQQRHYDYGLRAVKSVLVMAGTMKRAEPDVLEDITLVRALRDSNVPKFLAADLPLVFAILSDLFPGLEVPYVDYGELAAGINTELDKAGLQRVASFIKKIIQIYDTTNVRFGVCLVGPSTGGKTTAYQILAKTMTTLHENGSENENFGRVFYHILNPKSISMGELYGEFNELTAEWADGLASTIMRDKANMEDDNRQWVMFDGPVDTLWIESLNTVLDDNMTLCLANGERVKLRPQMKILFECNDLEQASPATVSRIGVVYLSLETVQWLPCVQTWLGAWQKRVEEVGKVPEIVVGRILELFETTMADGLRFMERQLFEPIPTLEIQIALSLCNLFTSMWKRAVASGKLDATDETQALKAAQNFYAFSFVWTVGGSCDEDSREKFDNFVSSLPGLDFVNFNAQDCYSSYVDPESFDFVKWQTIVPAFEFRKEASFFDLVVPTVDTTRFSFILKAHLDIFKHVAFTGVTGTGKTATVNDLLNRMKESTDDGGMDLHAINLNFSAQTASLEIQNTIEEKLEKKQATVLGPPGVKKIVVVFVDDVNMPAVEEYGAQPPIELLRQICGFGGIYDRAKMDLWKDIQKMSMVIAAAPPEGGRNPMTMRFSSLFHILCIPSADDSVLSSIFGAILHGFLHAYNFMDEIRQSKGATVKATIDVYQNIALTLRPTPAKFHYTFNLRDVSKVFQGLLMVRPRQCNTVDTYVKLWTHETMRVFHDRLRNMEDKRWFTEYLIKLASRYFGIMWKHENIFESKTPLVFGDFLKPGDDAPYELAKTMAQMDKVLYESLEDYNLVNASKMQLVFFRDAVEHVSRISRVLRQPRGNAMLVGVGGSGKQSLCRMAASMGDMECIQIGLTRGYGQMEFREDIKEMMLKAGVEGKKIAFLFCDTQIVHPGFLEDINNVLNTGEITGLYANDEVNKISEDLLPVVTQMGLPGSRDVIWRTFVKRIRDNLHVVLCMSPVGDDLRVYCRQYPSLINCCTIDWFMKWPRDALISVSQAKLGDRDELGDEETRAALAEMCARVHQLVETEADRFFSQVRRKTYITPKSYLDLISLYLTVLQAKRDEISKTRNRLQTGVVRMEETNEKVAGLKTELTALQPVLEENVRKTSELLVIVTREKADAQKVRDVTSKEEQKVSKKAAEVQVVKDDAQKDLDKAMPALNSAVKALNSLNKSDIGEVKQYATPPSGVKLVMEAVCTLLGAKTDWPSAKKLLGMSDFMEQLIKYDKDNISEKKLKKLRGYTKLPEMAVAVLKKVSVAATSMCMWAHAMDVYAGVAKTVGPKKERLAQMSKVLSDANALLASKQADLKKVEEKVASLQNQLEQAESEKQRLQDETEETQQKLIRAEKLTKGLADEYIRWKASVQTLDKEITDLTGDCFLSATMVSYLGPFVGEYRKGILKQLMEQTTELKIPRSTEFSLMKVLGQPIEIRQWQLDGLPTDEISTDNAIMVTWGERWPLMIDPQEQAKTWIKRTFKESLEVIRLNNPNMLRSLENCVRIGRPLLIEDIGERLAPALEPILQKAIYEQGGRRLIHIGDSDVDYDDNFKFYLTTKMPNPHYLPEVCIKVTVINFMITTQGLEDQLLGDVVIKEAPEVQEQKNALVVRVSKGKAMLQELEDKILKLLSEAEGDILSNGTLIDTLSDSKKTSIEVNADLAEALETEVNIDALRSKYYSCAVRGSLIYFVIADLAQIDPMYEYSLKYYKRLYNMCIDNSEKSDDLEKRLTNIIDYLTLQVYRNICRGLFSRHEILFSLLITIAILKNEGIVKGKEWTILLRGAGMVVNERPKPLDILSTAGWNLVQVLEDECEDAFGGLAESIEEFTDEWVKWGTSKEPQFEQPPNRLKAELTPFQKMLLLKVFREEKLVFACQKYVADNLGKEFAKSPQIKMSEIYADSDPLTPVIFILSTGADPTDMFYTFTKSMKMDKKMKVVALGQGQGPRASAAIDYATKSGTWVMLQNCHLGKSWLPTLEGIVDDFKNIANLHKLFRLFLTSMPATYFPVPILQNGIKLTTEPPKGIRQNMYGTLSSLDDWSEGYENIEERVMMPWKKLSFTLCFFHACLQERRKFGALGFNIPYEFNNTDLDASIKILKMFLTENSYVPYDAIQFIVGQISYGGRVTDDWDRRCVTVALLNLVQPQVLKDGHKFSESGVYYPPPIGSLDSFKEYVNSLPLADECEAFGMHENANISCQQRDTNVLLADCVQLQPRVGGNDEGKSPDEVVTELAQDIESRLPKDLDLEEAGDNTFVMIGELMDSLSIVLKQEMLRYNKLLGVMRKVLRDMQMAIRGETLMSDTLDSVYFCLTNNMVPPVFKNAAYASLKPLASWVNDLMAKLVFMREWLVRGKPKVFWLAGLFFPQGFTTGVLQNHARKYKLPIDTLNFGFVMQKQFGLEGVSKSPEDGVLISGIFMDGAVWDADKQSMVDPAPRQLFSDLPNIHFTPEVKTANPFGPSEIAPEGVYELPVYKTSVRAGQLSTTGMSTNFIIAVEIPSERSYEFWVLRGIAGLSQLDD